MSPKVILPLLLCTVVVLFTSPASAVVVRPSVSVGMGTAVVESEALTVDSGPTFGGELLFGVSPAVYIGAAFDYSTFSLEEAEDDLGQIDINASIRYFFPAGTVHFYVGGFGGYSQQSFDAPGAEVTQDLGAGGGAGTWSANGFNIGATLGMAIGVGPVAFEVSAGAAYNSFGDLENETADQSDPTAKSGMRYLGRIGIALPLGAAK